MRLKMKFEGGALALFGYTLLSAIMFYLLVIPGAWGIVMLYGWMARNTKLSDGSAVDFLGKPLEVLKLLLLMIAGPLLVGIIAAVLMPSNGQPGQVLMILLLVLYLCAMVVALFFAFKIWAWVINSIQFSWGGRLNFSGSFLGFIGWILLTYVSAFLIIAPFWVMSALIRWVCENTASNTGDKLVWVGTGWGLLWRTFVTYLACIFIIPIPWMIKWFLDWFIESVEVERAQAV